MHKNAKIKLIPYILWYVSPCIIQNVIQKTSTRTNSYSNLDIFSAPIFTITDNRSFDDYPISRSAITIFCPFTFSIPEINAQGKKSHHFIFWGPRLYWLSRFYVIFGQTYVCRPPKFYARFEMRVLKANSNARRKASPDYGRGK